MNEQHVHWPRVLAHAAIALVLAFAFVGGGLATFTSLGSYDAVRIAGVVAIAAAIAGGVASYLAQRDHRRTTTLLGAALAAVLVLGAAAVPQLMHHEPRPSYVFTAADRAPLVETAGRLRHPTLGFSLAMPAGFTAAAKLAEAFGASLGSNSVAYGYSNPAAHATLLVLLLPATGSDADALGRSLDDFVHGMTTNVPSAVVRERSIGSNAGRIHVQLARGHLRADIHRVPAGSGWVHVLLVVGSIEPAALTDVLASFQP